MGDYVARGIAYFQLQEYDKALADFDKIIELQPKVADVYAFRGAIYGELQNYQKAIIDFNKAIELQPKESRFYHARSSTYLSLEKYQKALEDCNQISSNSYMSHDCYGAIEQKQGRYQQAISHYNKALDSQDIPPDDIRAIYMKKGFIDYEQGKIPEAIDNWQKALAIETEIDLPQIKASIQLGLAVALFDNNKPEEARKITQQALENNKQLSNRNYRQNNTMFGEKLLSKIDTLFQNIQNN